MTTEHRTTRTSQIAVRTDRMDFPMVDEKGRRIGARATIILEQWETVPATTEYASSHAPGPEYFVSVSSQRNGADYGAGFNGQRFATLADAEQYLAKYLRDAAKRAPKVRGATPKPLGG